MTAVPTPSCRDEPEVRGLAPGTSIAAPPGVTPSHPVFHALATLCLLSAACSGQLARGGAEACSPGATIACDLPTDDTGTQTCSVDGRWEACTGVECPDAFAFESCTTESGGTGEQSCQPALYAGGNYWSACASTAQCDPSAPDSACSYEPGSNAWINQPTAGPGGGSGTPLVLSFDGGPVRFTHASGSFDLMGEQASFDSDWVSRATPWLALDRNGNGAIDDGRELFGSMTVLASGTRAINGFIALAELDDDGDGRITPADAAFSRLLLWSDADQDRRSRSSELRCRSAAARGPRRAGRSSTCTSRRGEGGPHLSRTHRRSSPTLGFLPYMRMPTR